MTIDTNDSRFQADGETICLICQCAVGPMEPKSVCPECGKSYHSECWEENKGCAVYGCPEVPPTEALHDLEIPVSYWGKEKKTCPSCGQEILAAALRCSHCGTIFSSARPLSREEFREAEESKENRTTLKRGSILVFIVNLLTFTAPIGAIFGFFWYRSKSKSLKSVSTMYPVLVKIGLGIGIMQTVLIIVFGIIYSLFGN